MKQLSGIASCRLTDSNILSRMNDARLATKRILSLKPRFSLDAYHEPQPYKHHRDLEERISLLRKAGLPD